MLTTLNRVSLRAFTREVRRAGFTVLQCRLLPVGFDQLRQGSLPKRIVSRLFALFAKVPVLQEAFVTKMSFVLQKPAEHSTK